ncbi:MAG: hypothetical protein AAF865_17930 [Pseudomonadota bacterium]
MSFGQISAGRGSDKRDAGRAMPAGLRLALVLATVWAGLSALTLVPGALVLSRHEGDAIHLAAMVLRMAEGQWPHLDYMTPIGILAVAPIAGLVAFGLGIGQAFIWSQVFLALALLPAIWWVATSRFGPGWLGALFGALTLAMVLAYVHGGTVPAISISMHYNRWAWAVAFLIVALVLVPSARGPAPRIEGAILGVGLAVLALTKVTYSVALLPAVLVALVLRREGATFAWGLIAGLAVLAAVTALGGLAFWQGYLGDLLAVAGSESRSAPALSLTDVLVSPAHIAGTLCGLAAVLVLRKSGHETEGVVMLALLPGLVLITWQNFGNDSQWLPVIALVLLALRPAERADAYLVVAAAAFAISLGWVMNVSMSAVRMATADVMQSGPVLRLDARHDDFRLGQPRLDKVEYLAPYAGFEEERAAPDWGADLPACDLRSGGVTMFRLIAAELEGAGFAGRPLLVADTFQSFWLFGPFPALPGGAPWYYDGMPGGASAELVVVPLCPINDTARDRMLTALDSSGWGLREVHRGAHTAVLEIVR